MKNKIPLVKVCKCGSVKFKCIEDRYICKECKRLDQYIEEKENEDAD